MSTLVAHQVWRLAGADQLFSGDQLAARLVRIGARKVLEATVTEMEACPIGSAINTGVSSWERTR